MSVILRSKLFEGKSGYFSDSIAIGLREPSESLHISGGNLKIDDGGAIFSNRPVVSGVPVLLSGDFDVSNFYTRNNPSGYITGIDTSNFYTKSAALDVSGEVSFTQKPTVAGVPVMLSGDFNSNLENLYTEIYNTQNNSIMYALALG